MRKNQQLAAISDPHLQSPPSLVDRLDMHPIDSAPNAIPSPDRQHDEQHAEVAVAASQRIFREVLAGWFSDLLEARRQGLLDFSWNQPRQEELWHAEAA